MFRNNFLKKRYFLLSFFVFTLLLIMPIFSAQAADYYVDASQADDAGDGSSWGAAKKYLQSAFALVSDGDTIYVAEGTYYRDEGTGQTEDLQTSIFNMVSGVAVYGGYPAGGGSRDVSTYTSTLSGDIDKNSTLDSTNSNTVVKFNTSSSSTILDGFTVTMGYRDTTNYGGGIQITGNSNEARITGCTITNNYTGDKGGGIYIKTTDQCVYTLSPVFTNCTISNNTANQIGGGIYAYGYGSNVAATFNDCTITNNTANADIGWGGGGGYGAETNNSGTTANIFTNCTFSENTTPEDGAGLYIYCSWIYK